MEVLLDNSLRQIGILTEQARELFAGRSSVRLHTKGTNIMCEGKSNDMEYILLDGVLHRYNINLHGDTITTGFYLATTPITPHFARTIAGKNIFSLEALVDSVVAEIPVAVLDQLRNNNPDLDAFGNRTVANELLNNLHENIVNRSMNARERLLLLRKRYPLLENLVPHSRIASYLGITNVSLSRLRNELSH